MGGRVGGVGWGEVGAGEWGWGGVAGEQVGWGAGKWVGER